MQGDEVWRLTDASGKENVVGVRGPLTSNNLSILLSAARAGMGIAILPMYLAADVLRSGELRRVLPGCFLPQQEINVVFPSPRFVPAKVLALTAFLQQRFRGEWWTAQSANADRARGYSAWNDWYGCFWRSAAAMLRYSSRRSGAILCSRSAPRPISEESPQWRG